MQSIPTLQFFPKFDVSGQAKQPLSRYLAFTIYNKPMENVLKSIFLTYKTFVMIDPTEIYLNDFGRI